LIRTAGEKQGRSGRLLVVGRARARYGIDGGYFGVPFFVLVEAGLLAIGRWARRRGHPAVTILARMAGVVVLGSAASYFYTTGPGKLSIWQELLDELDLRGDERVLDIGCGRGAVLIAAAHRVPEGRVTGVDIWRLRDQTGNNRAATERNTRAEGVSERVELADADARHLPFPSESFDTVVSSRPSTTSKTRTSAPRPCERPSGSFVLEDSSASSMIVPTDTPRWSEKPDALTSRCDGLTGVRGSAFPAII